MSGPVTAGGHSPAGGLGVPNPLGPEGRMAVARELARWATAFPATDPSWDVTSADELLEFVLLVQRDTMLASDVDRLWRLLGYWYEGAEGEDLDPTDPAWPVAQICEAYLDQVDAGNEPPPDGGYRDAAGNLTGDWSGDRQRERFPWNFDRGTPPSERLGEVDVPELLD